MHANDEWLFQHHNISSATILLHQHNKSRCHPLYHTCRLVLRWRVACVAMRGARGRERTTSVLMAWQISRQQRIRTEAKLLIRTCYLPVKSVHLSLNMTNLWGESYVRRGGVSYGRRPATQINTGIRLFPPSSSSVVKTHFLQSASSLQR